MDSPIFLIISVVSAVICGTIASSKGRNVVVWVLLGLLFTLVYSMPALGRTKADTFLANLTIAVPRGCLLKVAGWAMVAHIWHVEPWYIGGTIALFLMGAASTKDFADIEGDLAGGCKTPPILYGPKKAAYIISPFFVSEKPA